MARRPHKAVAFDPLPSGPANTADKGELSIEGLRQNNLKNISLRIPHDRITAIVGLSGSGKSSLAFDTLFAEGRWRFIESLSTYTRLFLERMDRPDLDRITNIRPAIAIEQKNPVRGSRSTVGTATELNDYLRVLFARTGSIHCPQCGKAVTPSDPALAAEKLIAQYHGAPAIVGFIVPVEKTGGQAGDAKGLIEGLLKKGFVRIRLENGVFDISNAPWPPAGAKAPNEIAVIADRLILRPGEKARLAEAIEVSFREGAGDAWVEVSGHETRRLTNLLRCAGCAMDLEKPSPLLFSFNHPVGACPECKGFGNILKYDEYKIVPRKNLTLRDGAIEPWTKPAYTWWQDELEKRAPRHSINLDRKYSELTAREKKLVFEGADGFEGVRGFFDYLETKKYKLHVRVFLSRYKGHLVCPSCNGARLKKKALAIKMGGMNIAELSALTILRAREFFSGLELPPSKREIAKEALRQINSKLEFLDRTGLGYLTLDRLSRTLSGGEAQRVALANQLASMLSGVLYILDEPSVGLHPRDIAMLVGEIKTLASRGNTVVVVEHDPSAIKSADYIVELGPGSGEMGGRVVFSGTAKDFMESSASLTALYLTGRKLINVPCWRRKGSGRFLVLKGASGNNLKGVDVKIPLQTLTCVTGVSGSGKSTLVTDTLYNALAPRFGIKAERPLPHASIEGAEHLTDLRLIDQGPIGKTPRSNPVTYIGGFDDIRHFFSTLRSAAGLRPGMFSFNVPGGRCEACRGEGVQKLEMYFLPDVYITCPGCNGKRYRPEVLEVRYDGRNIHDSLNMTFCEASRFFQGMANLSKKISLLREVGLGYLRLGQSATTLSGGEAQRLKIARELAKGDATGILYILDEPTTGLHPDDIKKLLSVLGRLVDAGNTVIMIEHNLDCMKTADHIIDLGPEGGPEGGRIIAEGAPERIARVRESHTGRYLGEALR
ncbi:MAG: excinuclease ABC subunit UvrA [Deltaproteobacteria bacterium]|nr:excinuclease ABC subunit UvrA [Deltaproteobacteria bacterium]